MTETVYPTGTTTARNRDLLAVLDRALAAAGIFVATELDGTRLILSGEVNSPEERQAALDIAGAVAAPQGLIVDDGLDLVPTFPDSAFVDVGSAGHGAFGYLTADRDHDLRLDAGLEDEPDFAGDVGTTDAEEATEEDEAYFAPTDPVVRPSTDAQELAIVGGFGATSMDVERREAGDDRRRDDDIAQDVLRELREDALTTDLVVDVDVRNGVVMLAGEVPMLDDAENAEAVASRIGGVKEVREELTVASVPSARGR
jgi:osmotically-inducible protein OsmY